MTACTFTFYGFFMQLFLCEFQIDKNQIIIVDQDVFYQLRKVLRSKIGDIIFVQKRWKADHRYEVKIDKRDDKKLVWNIINTIDNQKLESTYWMIICMPNKWDKAEIIVQKLTEINIAHIIFWPSERSIIRQVNKTKIERLEKISKEAVEQSWWWNFPKIEFVDNLDDIIIHAKLVVFDKTLDDSTISKIKENKIYWLVWPEWGLTDSDYKKFGKNFEVRSLWENIFRTETAAIIGAWEIVKAKSWK